MTKKLSILLFAAFAAVTIQAQTALDGLPITNSAPFILAAKPNSFGGFNTVLLSNSPASRPLNFVFTGKCLGSHDFNQLSGGSWASKTAAGTSNTFVLSRIFRSNCSEKPITDVQCLFQNAIYNFAGSNVILYASLEYPSNVFVPLTFSGNPSANISVLGGVLTDPLGVIIPPGSNFWVRSFVTIPANSFLIENSVSSVGNYGILGGATNGGALDNLTLSGTIADRFSFSYAPSVIVGKPVDGSFIKSVCVLGDSWFSGGIQMYDTAQIFDSTPQYSACYSNGTPLVPVYSLAIGGNTLHQELATNLMGRADGTWCSDLLCELGINDIRGQDLTETNAASIEANYLTLWNYYASRGVRVWQIIPGPNSTSTDGFTTIENQTPINPGIHQQVCDWIRTKPSPLSGYFDTSSALESSTNSDIWLPGFTSDGLHIKSNSAQAQTNYINVIRAAISVVKSH